ncbi:uncharacterized protein LOC104581629 isoform X2 [Brachypodium distachyon]|uniref:uncharacterized protein LOC104581629 isoform X2 n=1 Tax=Brachypodium distachyon TaxID=15368 RepID=UPI00053007FF|nr:uncharacterized protein LOC104581629 isoform X2 [Brachypodium distachyon]|eukprot:XP_010227963.1 uncharacterized protein LOC104581629 isoform X2 [Brachypodium distachyon]
MGSRFLAVLLQCWSREFAAFCRCCFERRLHGFVRSVPKLDDGVGSFWWRDLVGLIAGYKEVARCLPGGGSTISFWKDAWDSDPFMTRFSRIFSFAINKEITLLEFHSALPWIRRTKTYGFVGWDLGLSPLNFSISTTSLLSIDASSLHGFGRTIAYLRSRALPGSSIVIASIPET